MKPTQAAADFRRCGTGVDMGAADNIVVITGEHKHV